MTKLKNLLKYYYYYLILRYKYKMFPNNVKTYDLKINAGFKNATLKK